MIHESEATCKRTKQRHLVAPNIEKHTLIDSKVTVLLFSISKVEIWQIDANHNTTNLENQLKIHENPFYQTILGKL